MLPAFTFIACANVVRQVGADVVFVDIAENDVNMDFEDLKRKFSKRVKCIMIVDQIGVPIEVEKYIKFCRKEKIHLIHDIACSLGSKYKKIPSGSSSEFLITSFHARKNMIKNNLKNTELVFLIFFLSLFHCFSLSHDYFYLLHTHK